MTDELGNGKSITSFLSTGPKSYSFLYGDNQHKIAVKGFTLNHQNSTLLNRDSFRKIVEGQLNEIRIVNESKIRRTKDKGIVNEWLEKMIKFGYDKRSSNTKNKQWTHKYYTLWIYVMFGIEKRILCIII